jgi:hypothetical protein
LISLYWSSETVVVAEDINDLTVNRCHLASRPVTVAGDIFKSIWIVRLTLLAGLQLTSAASHSVVYDIDPAVVPGYSSRFIRRECVQQYDVRGRNRVNSADRDLKPFLTDQRSGSLLVYVLLIWCLRYLRLPLGRPPTVQDRL